VRDVRTGLHAGLAAAFANRSGVVVASASGTSVGNVSFTEIVTGSESTDKEGWHNTSNGRITPTRPGWYLHYVHAYCGSHGTGNQFIVGSGKNGSTNIPLRLPAMNDAESFGLRLHYLNGTTDYVSLWVYQSSGSTKTVTGDQALFYLGEDY